MLFACLGLALMLAACSPSALTPTATPGHNLLYALTFDNEAAFSGWHVGAPGQYEWLKNVKDGKYLFEYPSGFLESQDFDFGDAQIGVDVEFLVKTRVEVGLSCRMQPDVSGRYYFSISNDGRWSIHKSNSGDTILTEGWSDQIKPDKNRLAVRCVGDQLTLLVNDVELGSARDSTFVSGSISFGYAAETAGAGTFDNITVEDWGGGQASASQASPETGEILYAENFDNPEKLTGWDAKLDEKSQANPQDGAYRLSGDSSMAALIQREQTFSDAVLEVDVKILGPARVGILCRNETGNYAFLLTEGGVWVIENSGKILTSGNTTLQSGFNHLTVSCVGNQLGFALNGAVLGAVQDESFQQGQIGFTLETKGKAEAIFDNLTVRRPVAQVAETIPTQAAALELASPTPAPVATATPTPTLIPAPAATLRPTVIPEGELAIYQTKFDEGDPSLADWKTFAYSMDKKDFVTAGYEANMVNGVYRMRALDPIAGINLRVFAIYDQDLSTADVDISVQLKNGHMGLVCRYSETGWYQFMVEPEGIWSIRLVKPDENGQFHFYTISSGLRWGRETLRAECKGDRLTFYIDSEKMASLHDQTFPTGKVGLLGWNFPISGEIGIGMKPGDLGAVDNFIVQRAQWNETSLPGPAPTPGAEGTIYSTDFAKLDDLNPHWAKTDWGVIEIPGSPLLIGGPGGQIAPHTYRYVNDFDPGPDIEIEADIRGAYNFTRGLICRYTEDGWYETYYQKGSPDDFVTLVRQQRNEQGKIIKGSYTVLGTYILPMISQVNLTLTCAGNQISVKLNGEQVLSAEDTTWTSGRYGFVFMDNSPGNIRNTLLNYSVRPAQAVPPGEVVFQPNLDSPEKIMEFFRIGPGNKTIEIQDGAVIVSPTDWLISSIEYLPKDTVTTMEVEFLNSEGFIGLGCRTGANPPAFQLWPDGGWAIFADEQMKANGKFVHMLPGKNQIQVRCMGTELTLIVNGETISSVEDQHVDERTGQISLSAIEGLRYALHSVKITATQSLNTLPVPRPLNQVSLPPSYQPGETIFAWDMQNFLSGCGGGWWGRDPNPCWWTRAYVDREHLTDSAILVTPNAERLTNFTYRPGLYDLPVEISAETTFTSQGGGAALFCRATANGRYEFLLQPDGKWFIRRNVNFEYELPKTKHLTILANGTVESFTPAKAQMSATCNGPELIFSLNGAELGRVQDTLYPEGQAGIFFDAFSEGSFTNLVIKRAK
jgi:hypothetical protein